MKIELQKEEKIILVLRKHLLTLVLPLIKSGFLVLVSLILFINYAYSNQIIFIILFVMFIFGASWVLYIWVCWWGDVYIITNQRLVDINRKGIFSKKVTEVPLEKIQDVAYEVKGPVATILKYGTILISTASAEKEALKLEKIKNPEKIQGLIFSLVKRHDTNLRIDANAANLRM